MKKIIPLNYIEQLNISGGSVVEGGPGYKVPGSGDNRSIEGHNLSYNLSAVKVGVFSILAIEELLLFSFGFRGFFGSFFKEGSTKFFKEENLSFKKSERTLGILGLLGVAFLISFYIIDRVKEADTIHGLNLDSRLANTYIIGFAAILGVNLLGLTSYGIYRCCCAPNSGSSGATSVVQRVIVG